MFAKRAKPPSATKAETAAEDSRTTPPAPDPRDTAIERLERELLEQRTVGQSLREALDAATFRTEVLEKSYAKQLADTREKLAATERTLADKERLLAALDGGHEDALRALNEARAELQLLTAERDQLRKQIAQGGFRDPRQPAPSAQRTVADGSTDSGGTINQLIASAGWAETKPAGVGDGHSGASVAAHEGPGEDMLAPELVFTKGKAEDDER